MFFKDGDKSLIGDLKLKYNNRKDKRRGGIGIVFKSNLKYKLVSSTTRIFEILDCTLQHENSKIFRIICLYSPPHLNKTLFIDELSEIIADS